MAPTVPEGLPRFVDALKAAGGATLVSVVLFGSQARGAARPDSVLTSPTTCRRSPSCRPTYSGRDDGERVRAASRRLVALYERALSES